MDSTDWSNRIRYHIFDARPDTEFNAIHGGSTRGNKHVVDGVALIAFQTQVPTLSPLSSNGSEGPTLSMLIPPSPISRLTRPKCVPATTKSPTLSPPWEEGHRKQAPELRSEHDSHAG